MITKITESAFDQFFKALLKGDRSECKSILLAMLNQNISIPDLYEDVFRRSLYQIGELWSQKKLTVADEHLASALCENLIAHIQNQLNPTKTIEKKVLISCVTSNFHQIGPKMVSNIFELHGWESYYLGANMPISDLIEVIDRSLPNVICLSIALVEHIKILELTVREIRYQHPQIPLLVGGVAFANEKASSNNLLKSQYLYILDSIPKLEQLINNNF
jgi:MerR family transcriptional regulator, light-induced transcriptional regulator